MVSKSTIAAIRFGYGFGPDFSVPNSADSVFAELHAGAGSAPRLDESTKRLALLNEFLDAKGDGQRRKDLTQTARHRALATIAAQIERRAFARHPFFERLSAFWADHFTVSSRTLRRHYFLGSYEDDTIRPTMTGRFADMLKAVVRSPAMLTYLDQVISIGPNSRVGRTRKRGLNENLAREVLELHTLGAGGPYSQSDVTEFAKLLTGFGARRRSLRFRFKPNWAEPGAETVLGKSYGGDPARPDHVDALLEDLAVHPATAQHLARKLAVHFVADRPDTGLVQHVAAAWTDGGGDLTRVYAAILEHPSSWSTPMQKVRRPDELIAATLRANGQSDWIGSAQPHRRGRQILRAARTMGQTLFQPPGPDGWPEAAEAWITPQGLAGRLQFASAVGRRLAKRRQSDPRDFAERLLGDTLRPETRFVVGAAPDRWEGFALAIASPEFNRR